MMGTSTKKTLVLDFKKLTESCVVWECTYPRCKTWLARVMGVMRGGTQVIANTEGQ